MKKKNVFSIPILVVGFILLLSTSCDKEVINDLIESTNVFMDFRDNNVYQFVTIGNQVWMVQNLKYLPRLNGLDKHSNAEPHYYVYDYKGADIEEVKQTKNYITHGVLYNWSAAMAGAKSSNKNPSRVQGVCPKGWHLPSINEWNELINYLGGKEKAGGILKESGNKHWKIPNIGGTDEAGFTALPSGEFFRGDFDYQGDIACWWSSTESDVDNSWCMLIHNDKSTAEDVNDVKDGGFSVRCVRD